MKKIILIMILLSSMCYSASFKIGASANYEYFKDYDETFSAGNYYYLGFGYNFSITDKTSFSFESLLGYNDSDNEFNKTHEINGVNSILVFFDFPFYFNYKLNDYISLYSGGYFLLPVIMQGGAEDSSEETEEINIEYNQFPIGGLLMGVKIPVFMFYIDLRYKLGLLTFYENTTVFDHSFAFFVGTDF